MVKIINPYNANAMDGIGASLAQLGQALFGDTLGNDLRRAKLTGMEMENQGRNDAATLFQNGGNINPAALAAAAARAGDPKFFDIQRGYAANAFGATDPRTTNAMVGSGMAYSTTAPAFNRTQDVELEKNRVNAQKVYDAAIATANNTPINVLIDGKPTVVSRSQAIGSGMTPVLGLGDVQGNVAQNLYGKGPEAITSAPAPVQKMIGAYANENPKLGVYAGGSAVWTPEGWKNAQTGVKLAPDVQVGNLTATTSEGFSGNSTVDRQLLDSRTATERATSAIDNLTGMLKQPNADQSTGYVGRAANLYTDIRSQLEAVTRFAGGETVQQAFNRPEIAQSLNDNVTGMFRNEQFNERVRQLGIDNAKIQSQVIDLAYMIAKATDPGGRMSNQDIENATRVVMGSILDPQSGVAVLQDLKARLVRNQQIYESNLARLYPQAAKSMAAQPSAATAVAPAQLTTIRAGAMDGSPAGDATAQIQETRTLDDGKVYVRIGNKWFEQ